MRVCLMANEGRIPQSPQRRSRQPRVIIPQGGWAWRGHCYMYHTVQTLGGILESFICTLGWKYMHNTHTHTHAHAVCTPGGIPKSFSANLRESLAPMLINVGKLGSQWREEIKRTQTENWGTVWGTKEILRSGDYENPSMKIYMTDQHKWRKYQNGVGKKKSRWRIKMELKWEKRCRKTGRGLLEQHVNHRRMWSYNEVGIWPAACRDPWNFKCRDFPLQQGRQLRRTHTLTRMCPEPCCGAQT